MAAQLNLASSTCHIDRCRLERWFDLRGRHLELRMFPKKLFEEALDSCDVAITHRPYTWATLCSCDEHSPRVVNRTSWWHSAPICHQNTKERTYRQTRYCDPQSTMVGRRRVQFNASTWRTGVVLARRCSSVSSCNEKAMRRVGWRQNFNTARCPPKSSRRTGTDFRIGLLYPKFRGIGTFTSCAEKENARKTVKWMKILFFGPSKKVKCFKQPSNEVPFIQV